MKRILFILMSLLMLVGCDNTLDIIGDVPASKPSELFVYSGHDRPMTRANSLWNKTNENGYSVPVDGKFDVWYFIRIDGNIPGEPVSNLPANEYFPQNTTGKTLIDDMNHGTVNAYTKWRENISKGFPKYIWGSDGSAVQSIIIDEPTLDDLLACNKSTTYDLSGYIEHKDELHFIWYVCKQQKSDHIWHIDGVLTSKDRTDLSQTDYKDQIDKYKDLTKDVGDVNNKANVEVDIHQQDHKDWNEIKTSIHLRDTVDVEVFIPIEAEYVLEADDFDIRSGKDYTYIENLEATAKIGNEYYTFNAEIKHDTDGIRIVIHPNVEALKAARKADDDGVTFEIHNYITNKISKEDIWDKLKLSTCKVIPDTLIRLFGQITSAYYPDEKIEL